MREKNKDNWLYLLEVVHELGHARLVYEVRRVTCVDAHFCGAGARGPDCVCVRESVCLCGVHTYDTYIHTYTYMRTCMHAYMHLHLCIHTYINLHTNIQTYIRTYV